MILVQKQNLEYENSSECEKIEITYLKIKLAGA